MDLVYEIPSCQASCIHNSTASVEQDYCKIRKGVTEKSLADKKSVTDKTDRREDEEVIPKCRRFLEK